MNIFTNSALVIELLGLNVPSKYPFICPLDTNSSIVDFAQWPSISENLSPGVTVVPPISILAPFIVAVFPSVFTTTLPFKSVL